MPKSRKYSRTSAMSRASEFATSRRQSGSCASDRPTAICNPASSKLPGASTLHKHPASLFSIAAIAAALALSACGGSSYSASQGEQGSDSRPASDNGQPSDSGQSVKPVGKPVPAKEPSESDIVRILKNQYARINAAGGMPVTATASGKSMVLKPKIWEAHKDEPCRPLPQSDPGEYECSLSLMMTMLEGDDEPGQHAERVHVSWDEIEGEWVGAEVLKERREKRR